MPKRDLCVVMLGIGVKNMTDHSKEYRESSTIGSKMVEITSISVESMKYVS